MMKIWKVVTISCRFFCTLSPTQMGRFWPHFKIIFLHHFSADFSTWGMKKYFLGQNFSKIMSLSVFGHFWRFYTRFSKQTREKSHKSDKTDKVQYLHGYFTDFSGYHMKRHLISAPVSNFIFWPISGQNSAIYGQKWQNFENFVHP